MKFTKLKRTIAFVLFSGFCSSLMASGTVAGTDVTNTATLSFGDNADTLEQVQSNSETFKVDKKVDISVTTIDVTPIATKPNATGVVLTYKVTNTGNSVQDFALNALTTSTKAFNDTVTDTFDATNVKVYVDDGDGQFDPAKDTQEYIDELGIDESKFVFIVSDIPANLQNGAASVYDLQAQVAQGGSQGVLGDIIAQDSSNEADNKLTVQIVFADSAGSADSEHDGKFSSVDAYKIVIANMTITKTSVVVEDPVNNTTNPKRIPGAKVRYCFTVENSGNADAAVAKIGDTADTSIYDITNMTNNDIRIYNGADAFDCSNVTGLTTQANPDNSGSVDTNNGKIVIDLGGVPAGKKKSAYYEVILR